MKYRVYYKDDKLKYNLGIVEDTDLEKEKITKTMMLKSFLYNIFQNKENARIILLTHLFTIHSDKLINEYIKIKKDDNNGNYFILLKIEKDLYFDLAEITPKQYDKLKGQSGKGKEYINIKEGAIKNIIYLYDTSSEYILNQSNDWFVMNILGKKGINEVGDNYKNKLYEKIVKYFEKKVLLIENIE